MGVVSCVLWTAGAAKLGLMCELYNRNKKEMSKAEKHEVLEYVRVRYVNRAVSFQGLVQGEYPHPILLLTAILLARNDISVLFESPPFDLDF